MGNPLLNLKLEIIFFLQLYKKQCLCRSHEYNTQIPGTT